MMLNYISLFLIFFAVIVIVLGIWKIHTLPGEVAKQRNHPQAEAIEVTAYLGLIAFPLWMIALIWAYMRPVLQPVEIENRPAPVDAGPPQSDIGQAAVTQQQKDRNGA